jgi:hypothetical protein
VAHIDPGALNNVVALGIAGVATLVIPISCTCAASRLVPILIGSSILWVMILLASPLPTTSPAADGRGSWL